MRYENIQHLPEEKFKRLVGVKPKTFNQMLEVVEQGIRNFGRPPKLSRADQLLLTLMYWREYRTEFHISIAYGVSESTVCRTIQKIENVLMESEQFHLPGKKVFKESETLIKVVLLDATEQMIERPKKSKPALTVAKNGVIPKKRS